MRTDLIGLRAKKVRSMLSSAKLRSAFFRHGVLAASEHRAPLRRTNPDMVIDAGANRGQFSLSARNVFPELRIVAFEPIPEAARIYESVFHLDENIILKRLALGEETGASRFFVTGSDDSSSFFKPSVAQTTMNPSSRIVREIEVEIRALSGFEDLLGRRCFLKIDVQGFELALLKGASDCLSSIKWIYVECSFMQFYDGQPLAADVIDYLGTKGFRLLGSYNCVCDASDAVLQADLLFERNDTQ